MIVETNVEATRRCPYCDSSKLHKHGESKPRQVIHTVATLKKFVSRISAGKVKEVCIDLKESLRKLVEPL